MNRRDIIKAGMSSVALTMVPSAMIKATENKANNKALVGNIYSTLVKHGHPKEDNKFLWSVMTVKDELEFLNKIDEILLKNRYSSALKYSSTDKFKIIPSKQVIDLIISDQNVSFDITVFKGDSKQFRNLSPLEFNKKMDDLYKKTLINGVVGSISSKVEDRYGPSDKYNEKFKNVLGISNNVKNAKFDKIIQVNDLVSGIIYSTFADAKVKSKVKLEINAYLNGKIGLSVNMNKKPFKIKEVKL